MEEEKESIFNTWYFWLISILLFINNYFGLDGYVLGVLGGCMFLSMLLSLSIRWIFKKFIKKNKT